MLRRSTASIGHPQRAMRCTAWLVLAMASVPGARAQGILASLPAPNGVENYGAAVARMGDIDGDGLIVELPGFAVDVVAPRALDIFNLIPTDVGDANDPIQRGQALQIGNMLDLADQAGANDANLQLAHVHALAPVIAASAVMGSLIARRRCGSIRSC